MYNSKVQEFLQQKTDKQKLIVIYGPTGAWKTAMSIDIAHRLGTEIISTDSRQIFRCMDIGTGKITESEKQWIVHHMIDIIDPNESFSVWKFVDQSQKIMEGLWNEWKIPMLVWGTGLYIDSLIFERNATNIGSDIELRKSLGTLSNEELHKKLEEIDSEYAEEIHPNNRPYVERAIEVKMITGKSKSEFRTEKQLKYDVLFLTPEAPKDSLYREWLYNRINTRVEMMFDQWVEGEVKSLLEKWYTFEDFGMNSIWYREFEWYFEWEKTKEEVLQKIQQNSRNYAKRQLTWFKNYDKYK